MPTASGGVIDTLRARLWRAPFDTGNEQTFVADRLNHRQLIRLGACEHAPGRGFGTDFWHAVEFSRNGRAPVEVSRPVVGQPLNAMSAASPLSKRGAREPIPRSGRSRVRLAVGRIETKNGAATRQLAASSTPATLRLPLRRTSQRPCRRSADSGAASGSDTRALLT